MANNYEFQTQTQNQNQIMEQEEGACALKPPQQLQQLQQQQQLESMSKIHCEDDEQQQQQLQLLQLQQQQYEQQQQLEQQLQQLQQPQLQHQLENVVPSTISETGGNFHEPKPYTTNIAVKGQNIKSKLNPLAQEFYPSYMRHPKNGYTTAHQMPNVVAIAAAATAAQYGYLDYDYNDPSTADWPTYEYDVVRYMDYERFMTSHMQRSNTVVPLVKNNYSGGSGSAAPPSISTSFQEQPSYEQLRKQRSFNRSYSSTSYNLRKQQQHHKNSKEVLRDDTRSWYIDKKAEEKRMESWKGNGGTADSYQDPVPTTSSSKEEFFETQPPNNNIKCIEKVELKAEHKESPTDQNHTPRAEGRTTQISPHKTKIPHKSKKQTEQPEISKKKLIMLYPSKRTESDLTQSSQDSMFTQPNSLEYTSDESFLAQISSESPKRADGDKNLNQFRKLEENENRKEDDSETTDSLEDFEMTTKPSEPKILNYSDSASPISVIEQEKPRKTCEKLVKPFLEPRIAINRLKKDVERKLNQKNKITLGEKISSVKKTTTRRNSLEKEASILKEVERQSHKVIIQSSHTKDENEKETTTTHKEVERSSHKIITHSSHVKEIKEPKAIVVTSGKFFSASSEGSKDDSKASYKSVRSAYATINETEPPTRQTHKHVVRVSAGGETTTTTAVAHTKTVVYTGTIPKNKETIRIKEQTLTTSPKISTKSSSNSPKSQREIINSPNSRKILITTEENPTKIARLQTTKNSNSNNKEEKPKLELWIQRPPNGIVANRVQIFANKPTAIGKVELHSYERAEVTTYKRHTPKTQAIQLTGADRKIHKAIVENILPPPPPPPPKPTSATPISIMKKTTASTVGQTTTNMNAAAASSVEKRSVVPKSIVKTQMRSTTHILGTSPHKKQNQSVITTKKESTSETKKTKSISSSGSRSVQPTSSRSIKPTGTTKITIREKSSSLKGVKAVIGSDGDNNAKIVSSKSCISLRPSSRKLVTSKPSVTSTKVPKKTSTHAGQKTNYSRDTLATTLRNLTKEKRRNPYTDPGTDYKIIQSTFVHK